MEYMIGIMNGVIIGIEWDLSSGLLHSYGQQMWEKIDEAPLDWCWYSGYKKNTRSIEQYVYQYINT